MLRGVRSVVTELLPHITAGKQIGCAGGLSNLQQSFIRGSATEQVPASDASSSGDSLAAGRKNNAAYIPWTPTSQLQKRKVYKKRMHYLIQVLENENAQKVQSQKSHPPFKAGDVLEIRMIVPEAALKEYILKGVCIARYNKSFRTTFKLYNVYPEVGGVVQHFPLYMPDILEIKVVGAVKTNKHKLFHLLSKETMEFSYQSEVEAVS